MTEQVTITSNHHWKDLSAAYEFTARELEHCGLDYIEGDEMYSPRLFRYRCWIYDASEFFRVDETYPGRDPHPFLGWHGYQSDSFFSGLLVRYDYDDHERVQVASYYC